MRSLRKFSGFVALLLVLSMTAVSFAGCNMKEKRPAEQQGATSPTSGGSSPAAANEKITFKILVPKGASEVPYDKMDMFKVYEEKNNVHINWDNPPVENFKERVNLVMASGDLPDMIVQIPAGDILKYAQMGAVIPLNDLIDKNAPNLKGLMAKYPVIRKWLATPDGKIYNLARLYLDEESKKAVRMNNPLQIRADWLEKLSLKEPVTSEEWYATLKAFKEKDPNGNGKQDEIPFSGNGIGSVKSLVRGWGVEDTFFIPKGKQEIRFGPIEDKFKDAITWLAQLYKEGLIDKEIATNDEKAFQGKVAQNLVGAYRGLLGGHLRTFNETLPKTIPGFKLIGVAPIKGPAGDQREPIAGITSGAETVITKACKKPDAAMKWLDYFYGDEGSAFVSFGPYEGKTYTKASDGHYKYTDFVQKNPEGMSAKNAVGTFSPVQTGWPSVHHYDTFLEFNPPFNVEALNKLVPYAVDSLPSLSFNQADDEMRRQVMNDVQTYVDEMVIKFIIGQEPLSGWDNYVKRVKDMNFDKVLKLYNDTYTEWLKK